MEVPEIEEKAQPVRLEDITIGGNEILSRGASDAIFRTYKPI